jgi:hypothetical protein
MSRRTVQIDPEGVRNKTHLGHQLFVIAAQRPPKPSENVGRGRLADSLCRIFDGLLLLQLENLQVVSIFCFNSNACFVFSLAR